MAGKGLPNWVPIVGVVVILVLVLGLWVMGIYNGEVTRDAGVQQAWGNVEVQYQRRFDLVPNVIATVQGQAGFEQETLTQLSQIRSQWQTQTNINDKVETANQFESTLSKILVMAEAYPTLTSSQAFQDLRIVLEGTENRISTERTRYNAVVTEYNVYISVFPNSIFLGGKTKKELFQSKDGSENPVPVPSDFT